MKKVFHTSRKLRTWGGSRPPTIKPPLIPVHYHYKVDGVLKFFATRTLSSRSSPLTSIRTIIVLKRYHTALDTSICIQCDEFKLKTCHGEEVLTEWVKEVGNFFNAACDHLDVLAVRPILLYLFLDAFFGAAHGCWLTGCCSTGTLEARVRAKRLHRQGPDNGILVFPCGEPQT